MHTEIACSDLDKLDRVKAIRAIHEAYLQLKAVDRYGADNLFNERVVASLAECLKDAGHIGFK
jgi:hypothetical protein